MGRVQREVHAPGHVRDPAVELTVDEVAQPPEGVAQGRGGRHEVHHGDEGLLVAAAEKIAGRHDADHPAMIGHAGDPGEMETVADIEGQNDFEGVGGKIGPVVKMTYPSRPR